MAYTDKQLREIQLGEDENLPVYLYSHEKYCHGYMKHIRLILKDGLNNKFKMSYCKSQINELRLGIEKYLPIIFYICPLFNHNQMREIRLGLEDGLDVTVYAYIFFSASQMKVIRLGLLHGINIYLYAREECGYNEMYNIYKEECMKKGIKIYEDE